MKRVNNSLVAILLVSSLTACGGGGGSNDTAVSANPTPAPAPAAETPPPRVATPPIAGTAEFKGPIAPRQSQIPEGFVAAGVVPPAEDPSLNPASVNSGRPLTQQEIQASPVLTAAYAAITNNQPVNFNSLAQAGANPTQAGNIPLSGYTFVTSSIALCGTDGTAVSITLGSNLYLPTLGVQIGYWDYGRQQYFFLPLEKFGLSQGQPFTVTRAFGAVNAGQWIRPAIAIHEPTGGPGYDTDPIWSLTAWPPVVAANGTGTWCGSGSRTL